MKQNPTLKNRLTTKFIITAVVPLVALGGVAIAIISSSLGEQITTRNIQIVRSMSGEIRQFLQGPFNTMNHISDMINTSEMIGSRNYQEFLDSHLKSYSNFSSFLITDNNGIVRNTAPVNPDLMGLDLSTQEFFKSAIQKMEPVWSVGSISHQNEEPSGILIFPGVRHTVVGYIDLVILRKIIEQVRLGNRAKAMIINSLGVIIAHENWENVSRQVNISHLIKENLPAGTSVNHFRFTDGGEEFFACSTRVPQTGWIVLVTHPVSEIFAPIYKITAMLVIIVILSILFAGLFALYSHRKITAPLAHLAENSIKVAQGDYSEPIGRYRYSSYREIEILSQNFDSMVHAVRSREQELENHRERFGKSLVEKEVMLKEIHHRVKNNMQIISSLLELQSDYSASSVDQNLYLDSQNRVRSMSLVHEKLYQSHNLSEINFRDYIKDLIVELTAQFKELCRGVSIKFEMQDVSISLENAVPCALIVNELVTNTIKHAFTGRESGTVTIFLNRDMSGGFTLSVSDDGKGLPEHFDFEKVRSMGLSLVRELVMQIKGSLRVERGKGAGFIITWGGLHEPAAEDTSIIKKTVSEDMSPRILIVEDERITALHIRNMLTKEGYQVIGVTASGEHALDLARDLIPDLIIMDIILDGELDGIDTVHAVHKENAIPVIFLTANTDPLIYNRAMETSPSGFISKPVDRNSLLGMVRSALASAA